MTYTYIYITQVRLTCTAAGTGSGTGTEHPATADTDENEAWDEWQQDMLNDEDSNHTEDLDSDSGAIHTKALEADSETAAVAGVVRRSQRRGRSTERSMRGMRPRRQSGMLLQLWVCMASQMP